MELKHITTEVCPSCGCRTVVAEIRENQHCNGEFNEYRKFSCDYQVHYSPNYSKERIVSGCTKSPEYIAREGERKVAKDRLIKYVERMNVDNDFKNAVLERLEYIRVWGS